jgi:hypothetical protein
MEKELENCIRLLGADNAKSFFLGMELAENLYPKMHIKLLAIKRFFNYKRRIKDSDEVGLFRDLGAMLNSIISFVQIAIHIDKIIERLEHDEKYKGLSDGLLLDKVHSTKILMNLLTLKKY